MKSKEYWEVVFDFADSNPLIGGSFVLGAALIFPFYMIGEFLRKEASMSPGGGESPAGSQKENQSSAFALPSQEPGDNREVGDTR